MYNDYFYLVNSGQFLTAYFPETCILSGNTFVLPVYEKRNIGFDIGANQFVIHLP